MPDIDSKPQRNRLFRWLRRLAIAGTFALVALALVSLFAIRHLDWIAKFAIHRIFPGVTAEMGSLHVISTTSLEVRKLILKSSKTKEALLSLEGGSVLFSFGQIWRAHLDEIRLESPNLVVSPDLNDALGVQPTRSSPGNSNPFAWAVDELIVNNGHVKIARLLEQSPTVEMDFSADFKNFGVGGDAAQVEHLAHLEKINASDIDGKPLLRIADIDVRFTTEELFTHSHLRAVRIGKGSLTASQSLFDSLKSPKTAQPNVDRNPGTQGWSIGALDLDGMGVTVPDAPGMIGRVEFRISAALRDLGAIGTPGADATQSVTVSRLKLSTDKEPHISLLSATEAEARFTIAGLAEKKLDELRFKNLSLDVTPGSLEPTPPGKPPSASTANPSQTKPPPWLIAHASCNFGSLRLRELKDGTLGVVTHFAFDMHDLGTTSDTIDKEHELTVWDTQATGSSATAFLTLDVGSINFTPAGLLEHARIEAVKIKGGRLLVGGALRKLLAVTPKPTQSPSAVAPQDESGWTIGMLDIAGIRTRIEDKRPGVTDFHFTINTTLQNVQANGVSSQLLGEVQTVELANIDLRSPLNRSAKILSLRSVFVRFTLRDLARNHLREVVLLQPSIFLSQDLFVYMERATTDASLAPQPADPAPAAAPAPNWSVDHLEVKFGRLVLGSGGSKDVGLPLEFETTADNLALDNLATLQLQAVLRVPKQSYDFPDYKIQISDAVGDLRFSYPPEKGEKNLVQKLEIAGVRWRQYRAKKAWVAATFDARGINGQFGGVSYGGYLNGGFSFFFQDDSPWIGWIAGTGIDTDSFTGILSPQNFRMTGPIDFEMQLDAFRKNIERVRGVFHLTEPGRFKIGKLDDLLANIPPDWLAIKKSSTRIALETLRDFDYTAAKGDFWFVQSQGILNLDLNGPKGSRTFEVALHDGEETKNQWQQGKLGKK